MQSKERGKIIRKAAVEVSGDRTAACYGDPGCYSCDKLVMGFVAGFYQGIGHNTNESIPFEIIRNQVILYSSYAN